MPYEEPKSQVEVQEHLAEKPAWKMTDDELKAALTTLGNKAFAVSSNSPSFTAAMAEGFYGKKFAELNAAQQKIIINVDLRVRRHGISTPKMHTGDKFNIYANSGSFEFGFQLDGAATETKVDLFTPDKATAKAALEHARLNEEILTTTSAIEIAKDTGSVVAIMRSLGLDPTFAGRKAFLKTHPGCLAFINSKLTTSISNVDTGYKGTAAQNIAFAEWLGNNYEGLLGREQGTVGREQTGTAAQGQGTVGSPQGADIGPQTGSVDADDVADDDTSDLTGTHTVDEPAAQPDDATATVADNGPQGADTDSGSQTGPDAQPPAAPIQGTVGSPQNGPVVADDEPAEPTAREQKREKRETRQRQVAFDRQWKRFLKNEIKDDALTETAESILPGSTAEMFRVDKMVDADDIHYGNLIFIRLKYAGTESVQGLLVTTTEESPYDLVILGGGRGATSDQFSTLAEALAAPLHALEPEPFTAGQVREVTTTNFDTLVKGYDGVSLVAFGEDGRETARQFALASGNEAVNVVVFADPSQISEPIKSAWLSGNESGFRFYKDGKWQGGVVPTSTSIDDLNAAAPETTP